MESRQQGGLVDSGLLSALEPTLQSSLVYNGSSLLRSPVHSGCRLLWGPINHGFQPAMESSLQRSLACNAG
eukprot:11192324-Lingulodinium_polyedra.AAC.1